MIFAHKQTLAHKLVLGLIPLGIFFALGGAPIAYFLEEGLLIEPHIAMGLIVLGFLCCQILHFWANDAIRFPDGRGSDPSDGKQGEIDHQDLILLELRNTIRHPTRESDGFLSGGWSCAMDGFVLFLRLSFLWLWATASADVPGNNRRGGRPPGPSGAPLTIVVPVEGEFQGPAAGRRNKVPSPRSSFHATC